MPVNISFGMYMFYGKVSYGIETAAAADVFHVVEVKPPTCFDGIQNQEEDNIDCGGSCEPCERRFLDTFKSLLGFIFFGLIIITLAITFHSILRKAPKGKKEPSDKIQGIYASIGSALSKGYKARHIREILLRKGLPKEIVDPVLNEVTSSKLNELKGTKQESKQEKLEPLRLSNKLKKQVVDYISMALNQGYSATEIGKLFLNVGWSKAEIEKHISDVLKSRLRRATKK